MARVYDDVREHHARLPAELPRKAAATPLGMFVAWCVQRDLTSEAFAREDPAALERLRGRWGTGRDVLLEVLDGRLEEGHLGPRGRAFAEAYLVPGTWQEDFAATLQGTRPSPYHVPDTWANLDAVTPLLDRRLAELAPEAAAPPPPPPPPPVPETTVSAGAGAPEALESTAVEELPADADHSGSPQVPERVAGLAPAVGGSASGAGAPFHTPRTSARPPPLPTRRHRPARRSGGSLAAVLWSVGIAVVCVVGSAMLVRHVVRGPLEPRRFERRESPSFDEILRDFHRREKEQGRSRASRRRSYVPSAVRFPRKPDPDRDDPLPVVRWAHLAEAQQQAARKLGVPVRFENELHMRFVLVPAGAYVMGSPPGEPGRRDGEVQHNVLVPRAFYLQTTEVSNAAYRRFDPGHVSRAPSGLRARNASNLPVTSVTWGEATSFCHWLSHEDGSRTYRLPTEAEWEYACRAGSATRFFWGGDEVDARAYANVADASARARLPRRRVREMEGSADWRWWPVDDGRVGLAPLGSYGANPWGLYDMIGNVSEWCADWAAPYDTTVTDDPRGPAGGAQRVIRGGSADAPVWKCRSAWRGARDPKQGSPSLGLRVVSPVPAR
jgi:formylglycine-generating enzyme required for sulfatase activity